MEIRKYVTIVEETAMEGGKRVNPPTRKAAAIAVIKNPFAGKYVENLNELVETGEELGGILTKRAVEALRIPPHQAESYGKAERLWASMESWSTRQPSCILSWELP